ncbi:MAG: diphosphate--fructose-6-phosphate 1-phosphotransferase [Oscillospiraceae bacterium]|nr:diphosphate--fructose-6-phosphate 1-phosphotransferase [Oscillospiraceae bacterium]
MRGSMVIIHGGGPTAVLNCSLYGAVREAMDSGEVERVYGAMGGTGGLLHGRLTELSALPEEKLALLPSTPGSLLGTSRDALEPADYARMADLLEERNIRYVLMNGGNGTMDACGKLGDVCQSRGIRVMGIPKTHDNDIAVTDHCPGYGSMARYMAGTIRELAADVRSLPIHVVIVEALGRNAGWTTASSALAAELPGDAPHLICLPERPFREEEFLDTVKTLYDRLGGVVVVASEGLRDEAGTPIVPPLFQTGRSVYFGDVSSHLAQLVVRRLGIKARSEKPGILARASIAWQSPVDAAEAELAGRIACRAVLGGESRKMVAFRRIAGPEYGVETFLAPIEEVMLGERRMPDEFIAADSRGVTQSFVDWCRPLTGGDLPSMARL